MENGNSNEGIGEEGSCENGFVQIPVVTYDESEEFQQLSPVLPSVTDFPDVLNSGEGM